MAEATTTAPAPWAPPAPGPLMIDPVEVVPQWEDATAPTAPCPPGPPPDSRSPSEFTCSEATAIRVLVKHYGWRHESARTLTGPRLRPY